MFGIDCRMRPANMDESDYDAFFFVAWCLFWVF